MHQNFHMNGSDGEISLEPAPELGNAIPARKAPEIDYSRMIAIITAWKGILNARLLAVLSLLGTLIGFGFCMWEPEPLRLWGLAIYAILCQGPVIYLYLRKG